MNAVVVGNLSDSKIAYGGVDAYIAYEVIRRETPLAEKPLTCVRHHFGSLNDAALDLDRGCIMIHRDRVRAPDAR